MMRKIVTYYVIEANLAIASIKIDYYNTKVNMEQIEIVAQQKILSVMNKSTETKFDIELFKVVFFRYLNACIKFIFN